MLPKSTRASPGFIMDDCRDAYLEGTTDIAGLRAVINARLTEFRTQIHFRHDALLIVFPDEEAVIDYVLSALQAEMDVMPGTPTDIGTMWICERAAGGHSVESITADLWFETHVIDAVLAEHAAFVKIREERIAKQANIHHALRSDWARYKEKP